MTNLWMMDGTWNTRKWRLVYVEMYESGSHLTICKKHARRISSSRPQRHSVLGGCLPCIDRGGIRGGQVGKQVRHPPVADLDGSQSRIRRSCPPSPGEHRG